MLKVTKFGGSSLADSRQFAKVRRIMETDASRRVIIVSAPGKRHAKDNKITDLLYLCKAHLRYDVEYESIFKLIMERFFSIREELGLRTDLEKEFTEIRSHLSKNVSADYLASRGEYLNARLMGEYLGYQFIDAKDVIFFHYDGTLNHEKTAARLREIYDVYEHIIIPGFYGSMPNGEIKVFSRGGSDITGAIVAAALDADIYENWTDVNGILLTDPRIVPEAKPIARVTYEELRELSYRGASVLHEDTIFPVRQKDIPLNIRNTNEPDNPGTMIRESFPEEASENGSRFVTGITGRKDYSIITISKSHLSDNLYTLRKVLELFDHYKLPIAQLPSGIDCFSVVTPTADWKDRGYELLAEIQKSTGARVRVEEDEISLISVVGRQMAYRKGVSGLIFSALGENDINIRIIEQSAGEINIMIGIATEDFEKAIRVLYSSFVK